MSSRGYAAIGLHNPKCGENVGGALRAIGVYGASLCVIGGTRPTRFIRHPTDTMKAYRSVPTIMIEDVLEALPFDCVPVAVDLLDGAKALPDYHHPERAFYVFGPEDGTIPRSIVSRCRDRVMVPTSRCMNLAATVNVVLYDRLAKGWGGP